MSTTPIPFCSLNPECDRRFDAIDKRLDAHSERLTAHGESLAALRAQVMAAAGFGSIVGGGIVALVVQLIGK